MIAAKPLLEAEIAAPEMDELTIVVLAPAVGAAPLLLPSEGVFGDVARNNTYPVTVAPEPGKVAAVQVKSILLADVADALNPDAWAVGAFESVRKLSSLPYAVPNSLVT